MSLTRRRVRYAWLNVAVAIAAAAVITSPRSAAGDTSRAAQPLTSCAYGTDVPGLDGYLANAVATAADSYGAGLTGDAAADQSQASQVFAAAAAAYVYGLPQVSEALTLGRLVPNEIVSVDALATPANQAVVAPNVQTATSSARLDLRRGPIVINVPNTHGLFYTFQFLDAYTNAFAYVGAGSTGTQAGAYALVPPGWAGSLPAGVTAIHSPTYTVWLIGRTLVKGPSGLATVRTLESQYDATPLANWIKGARRSSVVVDDYAASKPIDVPTGTAFITALNASLTADAPPAADDCALTAMAPAGVTLSAASSIMRAGALENAMMPLTAGTATVTATATQSPLVSAAVTAGVAFGAQTVTKAANVFNAYSRRANNGWVILGPWVGDFGTRYLARAIVTQVGLGANIPQQAIYPAANTDVKGQPLNGADHYTITFPKGRLPPTGAFWSITLYDSSNFLVANSINRYSIGNETSGLVFNRSGSLTIYIQSKPPVTTAEQANWLPAPNGPFQLTMRLYEPMASALDGHWKPPAIEPPSAPALSALKVSPSSFRPAKQGGLESAKGRVVISYNDTAVATTTFELIELKAHGRHAVIVKFTHKDLAGVNKIRITGRVNGHALADGKYLLRAVAGNAAGKSSTVTAHLRIT